MTEEVKKEEPKVETKEPSEVEQKAISMGWRPKEEWHGDETDFIDATEFVRRKPLFDKIESQKIHYDRKIKEVEGTLNSLAQHHQKVKETEYQRALKDLREQKRAAMKEGDTIVALELEDKMDDLTSTHQEEIKALKEEQVVQQPVQGPSPEFVLWSKENKWYMNDEEMHDFADGTAASFVQRAKIKGDNITEQDVFSYVVKQVKKAFPEKFSNPNRERPGAVSSSNTGGGKEVKVTSAKLSPEQEEIARNFAKSGTMTREKYIEELRAIGEI
jgi:hypothetical protein